MDITQRKQAEEALRASEERFRQQYKGVPLPTYSWLQVDDDFVMQDYNDAAEAIAEGDVREWIGQRASERHANEPEVLADLHICVTEQRTVRRELCFHDPISGRERDLALSCVFVPPRTVMLHNDDITERTQADRQHEAMAQSEKLRALGQMASGIAQDLNQSLTRVSSYSDLARQALEQNPQSFDRVASVQRRSRGTRAALEHDGAWVDLTEVVRDRSTLARGCLGRRLSHQP